MSELEPTGHFLVYRDEDGNARIDVRFDGETVWLTQAQLAQLFGTTPQNITQHIGAVYDEGELEQEATCKDYLQVRREGTREVRRRLAHYNLDVIISVGYRVRSKTATAFRIWATGRLREYIVKGFVEIQKRMADWIAKLDGFLTPNDRDILTSAGTVSHDLAQAHASAQFERFKQRESAAVESDFDRFSKRVIERGTEPEVES